jgi:hypothetical protein
MMKTRISAPASCKPLKEQNYVYPKELDYDRYIVGVSEQEDDLWNSYQFIFSDKSRTNVCDWDCPEEWWRDLHISSNDV